MTDYSFSCFRSPVAAEWRRVSALDGDSPAIRQARSLLEAEVARAPHTAPWLEVGRVGLRSEYVKLGTWRWVRGAAVWASAATAIH